MKKNQPGKKLRPGERLQVRIEGIGTFGEGLARSDGAEIFVPKTARGDELQIEIIEEKKGRYRARSIEMIQPSEVRVPPRCRHFDICGGCDFQHLPYSEQIAWKIRISKHWIRRSSLAPLMDQIIFDSIEAPEPYAYRHRVRVQVRDGKIHYFKPHSNELFEVLECPILVEGFLDQLKEKAYQVGNARDWNQSFMQGHLVEGSSCFDVGSEKISFNENCFTQANLKVNERMWRRIEEDVLSISEKKRALDLYSGVGNFTLPLSRYFKETTGIESSPVSVEWARKNSTSIRWISQEVESALKELIQTNYEVFDFVLLDPPRTGARTAVQILAQAFVPRITYVSCHLESLVADLVFLTKKANYKVERWTTVDLFPQTHHIESIVSLTARHHS